MDIHRWQRSHRSRPLWEPRMVFDVSVALTWILYIALFPIAFFWFRRAWRIAFRRDFSEVALKGGESPPNAEKYAPYVLSLIHI